MNKESKAPIVLISSAEVLRIMSFSRGTLLNLTKSGKLKAYTKAGSRWNWYDQEQVKNLIQPKTK